ncbi:hypothetical protein E2C01_071889 [Portunus trituberculatus]|uniref:Uncharacterized protein n=1 Tax=Portunus trituberculatus TaxID=210409 RepID=A0A5B7I6A1_PORTR|nr:hypothetical protein [Portunus trituberculatus]
MQQTQPPCVRLGEENLGGLEVTTAITSRTMLPSPSYPTKPPASHQARANQGGSEAAARPQSPAYHVPWPHPGSLGLSGVSPGGECRSGLASCVAEWPREIQVRLLSVHARQAVHSRSLSQPPTLQRAD